jgi:hypothetical protein
VKDEAQANPVFDQLLVGDKLHALRAPAQAGSRIICGMSQRRQRAGLAGVAVLLPLLIGTACQARSSVEAAQTAIVAAQTVLPGAQATAQAGATLVSSALGSVPVTSVLQALLNGTDVQVTITPDGAAPDAATAVTLEGTDVQGSLGQLDPSVRRAAAETALRTATQYFPNATISMTVKDASGGTLVSGSVAPGQTPSVQ